jgi:hypothetical protein
MKLTNCSNLPKAIYNAVSNDSYTSGGADISVTTLLQPPRKVALERTHREELVEDCSDRIWALMGQAMHSVLERSSTEGIAEKRLFADVLGWKISGQLDHFIDGHLIDYKFQTAYRFKDGKCPEEQTQQLNLLAHLLRVNGHQVNRLQIVGILRDWSLLESKRDETYPQKQVVVIDAPLWPEEIARQFIEQRVKMHQDAKITLPECSPEDRWARPDKWAIMKKGAVRAIKLYEDKAEAEKQAWSEQGRYVEHRPGEQVRCSAYCSVSKFCQQYKDLTKNDANQSSGQ